MKNRLLSKRGHTLLELTCAMFVISVGLFGVIHIYMRGMEKMNAINEYETALCALNNEMETLRAKSWEMLEPGEGLPFLSETPGMERLYLAEAQTCITAENESAALKRVTVRIRWIGEHGRRIEKKLTTLIAQTDTLPEPVAGKEEYAHASQS